MIKINCKTCNKEFEKYPSQGQKYCSMRCRDLDPEFRHSVLEGFKKSTLGSWRGTTKQIKNLSWKTYLQNGRKAVCKECGSEQLIDIHHIDENRLNNSPSNLEALCRSCHARYHRLRRKTCNICGQVMGINHQCPTDNRCKFCGQMLGHNHHCPTDRQRHKWGQKSILNRERCNKCGRMMGYDKHVCGPHPKGFLGHHHTTDAKNNMSKKVSKNKKRWWKEHPDWVPSPELKRKRSEIMKARWNSRKSR